MKICVNKEEIEKLSKKERCEGWTIYNENLAAVVMKRNVVTLNKPRYIGTAVLGMSKEIMYDFHYKYMMKEYPNAQLLFSDTDSFCYHIEADRDIYKDINKNKWYDFSNYVEIHSNFDDSKKLIPGYFKDEFGGEFILEFVGLRAKMYSILPFEGEKKATAKGINRSVKDDILTHQDYKTSLFEKQQFTNKMVRIQHEKHELYTMEQEKKSLNPFNDKKWITRQDDEFISYSYGHYKIKK